MKKTSSSIIIIKLFLFCFILSNCTQPKNFTDSVFENALPLGLPGENTSSTSSSISYTSSKSIYNIGIALKDDFLRGTGLIFTAFPISGKIRYHIKVVRTNIFPMSINGTIQLPSQPGRKFSLRDLYKEPKLRMIFNDVDTKSDSEIRNGDLFQIALYNANNNQAIFGEETPVLSFFYNPDKLFTWKDLNAIRHYPTKSFTFADNITLPPAGDDGLSKNGFVPIDFFSAILNGNNKVLKNLYIMQSTNSFVGLFSSLSDGAIVKDLIVYKSHVTGHSRVGTIAGGMSSNTVIQNVTVLESTTRGSHHVGGLVGIAHDSEIRGIFSGNVLGQDTPNSLVTGVGGILSHIIHNLKASDSLGGLVGTARKTYIIGRSLGSVSGNSRVGGLVGQMVTAGVKGYSSAVVTGNHAVGGLVGDMLDSILEGYSTQPIRLASPSQSDPSQFSAAFRANNKRINNWKQYRDFPKSSARGRSSTYLLSRGYGPPKNPDGTFLGDSVKDNGGAFLGSLVGIALGTFQIRGFLVRSQTEPLNYIDGNLISTKTHPLYLREVGFQPQYTINQVQTYRGGNSFGHNDALLLSFEAPSIYYGKGGGTMEPGNWPKLIIKGAAENFIYSPKIPSLRQQAKEAQYAETLSTDLLVKQINFYHGAPKKAFLKNYSNYIVSHLTYAKKQLIQNKTPKAHPDNTKLVLTGLAVGVGSTLTTVFAPEVLAALLPAEVLSGLFGTAAAATATSIGGASSTAEETALASTALGASDISVKEIGTTTAKAIAAESGGAVGAESSIEILEDALEEGSQITTLDGTIRKIKKLVDFVRIVQEQIQRVETIKAALTKIIAIAKGDTSILREIENHVNSLSAKKINLSILRPMALSGVVPKTDMLGAVARSVEVYQQINPKDKNPPENPYVLHMSIPHNKMAINGHSYAILPDPVSNPYISDGSPGVTQTQIPHPEGQGNSQADHDFQSNFLQYTYGSQIERLRSATNYVHGENLQKLDNLLKLKYKDFIENPTNKESEGTERADRTKRSTEKYDSISNYTPSGSYTAPSQKINSYFPDYAGMMVIFQTGIGNSSELLHNVSKHFELGNNYAFLINWFPGRYQKARGETKQSLIMYVHVVLHTELSYNINFSQSLSKKLSKSLGRVSTIKAGITGQLVFNHGISIPLKFYPEEQKWKVHRPGIDYIEEIIMRPIEVGVELEEKLNIDNLQSTISSLQNNAAGQTSHTTSQISKLKRLWLSLKGQVSISQENGLHLRWDLAKNSANAGKAMAVNLSSVILGNLAGVGLYRLLGGNSVSTASSIGEIGGALALGATLALETSKSSPIHPDKISGWSGGSFGLSGFFDTQISYLNSLANQSQTPRERISIIDTNPNRTESELFSTFSDFNIRNNLENLTAGGNRFYISPAAISLRLFFERGFNIYNNGDYYKTRFWGPEN